MELLEIENLSVEYYRWKETIPAVRDVSITLSSGEILGIVGESGCGKSTLALSILNIIPHTEGKIVAGDIFFEGHNIFKMSGEELRKIRGKDIGFIFQDPFSALNPVLTIKDQIEEVLAEHLGEKSDSLIEELLKKVKITDPGRILSSYPHQISGGQRQRVGIAMAISANPKIIIADEPTTALDVTTQKEILDLLVSLQKEMKMSIIFITHNLGIVSDICNKTAVMYAGEIAEFGLTKSILKSPMHPYTEALIKSVPRVESAPKRLSAIKGQPPILSELPPGCAFHPRCKKAMTKCKDLNPKYTKQKNDISVRCHLYD